MSYIKYLNPPYDIINSCYEKFHCLPSIYIEYSTNDFRIINKILPNTPPSCLQNTKVNGKPLVGIIINKCLIWHYSVRKGHKNNIMQYYFILADKHPFIYFKKLTIKIFIYIHKLSQYLILDINKYIKQLYIKLIK